MTPGAGGGPDVTGHRAAAVRPPVAGGASLADFLRTLRELRLRWRVTGGRLIRTSDGCCPLAAVARSRPGASPAAVYTGRRPADLARLAGVGVRVGCAVIEAADCNPAHDPATRRALLKAVGLWVAGRP